MSTPPLEHPAPPAGIGRVVTAMVTPFTADLEVDLDGVATLAEHLVASGSDTLLVHGTPGESPTLHGDEAHAVLRVVKDTVGDRATVMLGTGSNDTAKTVAATAAAADAGADAVLVVTPYYNRPDQRGLEAHFRAAAAATDLPVVLYDIPSRSARVIEVATHVALAEVENIVGVKDATADVGRAGDLLRETAGAPGGYAMWSGADEVNLPLLSVGAVGFVSVASHLVGPELSAMVAAFPTDPGRARQLHLACLPVHRALFAEPSPAPLKGALARLGLPAGPVRPPLADASPAVVDRLLAALEPVQEQR